MTAASRVETRAWRILMMGWLWSLVAKLSSRRWVYFTIALPAWWISSEELDRFTAKQLMGRLRVALYRAGAGKASGWLYAMLDGEFDGSTEGFGLHVHGIASKGMVRVLRRLRKQRQFNRNSTDAIRFPDVPVFRKVRIDRPRGHLPAGITYTSKSMWRQHNTQVDPDGTRHRVGRKHRISGLHRVRHLLWLDDNPVKDQVLLVHLSVINKKLIPAERGIR